MIKKILKYFFAATKTDFLLIVVIPIITIGFNWFENTSYYEKIIGTDGVVRIVEKKLLGLDYNVEGHHLLPSADSDFEKVWGFVKNNTSAKLPKGKPAFLSILNPENPPYVMVPVSSTSSKVLKLIPETVPVIAGWCIIPLTGYSDCQFGNNYYIVGSVGDFKNWVQDSKDDNRTKFNSFLAFISILVGVINFKARAK